ncbi:MAG TPA: radical SAM protein [Candidatus Acidoferrum sp.]|nr:radical SAM protein [Candidatus Acidoferrum sp.]
MRVALLYPEVYDMARYKEGRREFPPFGVLYLAAVIREAGHEIEILKVTPENTALDLRVFDAVGFSLASSATYGFMLEARNKSKFKEGVLILVGGVHCNFYPEMSIADFRADIASYGESEETILEMLERAGSGWFGGIKGTVWKNDGKLIREAPVKINRDIDWLPLPARHLLPRTDFLLNDRLAGTDTLMAHTMFSRGCPFPCAFCAAGDSVMQYRSGSSARLELEHLKAEYGIGGFAIVDDNFIVNRRKVVEVCKSIEDLGLVWSALSRVDTVNEEVVHHMARAGCIEIKFGMESGSEQLLTAMRKNTTQAKIRHAIDMASNAGIKAKVFIIHGYPGENMETTLETMHFLEELGSRISRVSLFRFVPLPGTQVYSQPGIRGTHLRSDWDRNWSKFHIHHNPLQWWGDEKDWIELEQGYELLRSFVEANWNAQG